MVARKGKRVRFLAPLMNKPLAARLLNREQHNNDRLARVDLSNYPAGSAMRAGLPPSMADLLARLSHDLVEVGAKKKPSIGGRGSGGGGYRQGEDKSYDEAEEEEEEEGGALRYIPVGDTRAKIEFIWRRAVKKSVFLCVDGWNRDEDMLPNQVTQSYSAIRYLPAGRYTYRFKVDGRYLLDPLSPTSGTLGNWRNIIHDSEHFFGSSDGVLHFFLFYCWCALALASLLCLLTHLLSLSPIQPFLTLLLTFPPPCLQSCAHVGSPGFQDPNSMRNLVIVVPHSTEPRDDATRKPITTVDLPQKSLGDDGAWVLRQALLKNRSVTVLNLQTNFISTGMRGTCNFLCFFRFTSSNVCKCILYGLYFTEMVASSYCFCFRCFCWILSWCDDGF